MAKRVACPQCKAAGRDSQNNHLKLYDGKEDIGYCFHCKETVRLAHDADPPKRSYVTTNNNNTIDLARVSKLPFLGYPDRKISKETMEFFGVRSSVNQEDGSPAEHFYPYFDEYGKVTGYKRRVLPKARFDSVEGSKIKSMFGKQTCKGTKFLIVVEGEMDCLSAHEMLKVIHPHRQPYNIVSLPHGANEDGTLDQTVRKELEWLGKFEKIVLILDMDAPGRAVAQSLADYLVSSVDVRIAELPLKDSADMWEAGREREWYDAITNARKYVSDQIVLGTDTPLEDLMKPMTRGQYFPFIPKTSKKFHGFRPREMTTIIAPPNVGKSSLMRQMKYHLLSHNSDPVGGFFLEEGSTKTKQAILAYHAGVALNEFRENPQVADRTKIEEAYETLLPRLHLFEHKKKVLTDDLIERKIEYMVKALGCRFVFLDHLSYIIGGRDSTNERKDIDMLMTRLSRSVEDWDYHLFLVSHIKRGGKEKSRRDGDQKYPYWEILDLSDGRGSGAIEQLSHNMIIMEKQVVDPSEENIRGLVRTRIPRSREWGHVGMGDYLTWDEHGRFTPVEEFS